MAHVFSQENLDASFFFFITFYVFCATLSVFLCGGCISHTFSPVLVTCKLVLTTRLHTHTHTPGLTAEGRNKESNKRKKRKTKRGMRRPSRWRHVVRPTLPFEASVITAVVDAAMTRMGMTRSVSTAPPISLLSWSVDGAGHTHRRCRRRLSIQERIPLICNTIREAAPDIVALQDSLPQVADALCSQLAPRHISKPHDDNTQAELLPADAKDGPQYELVGAVRNGRCGCLQLFRRHDSVWGGRLLLSCPSLTAEFVSTAPFVHDSASRKATESSKVAAATAVGGDGGGVRFVLTNVDLSYRGKSLAVGGMPLVSPDVSANGSPFTLHVAPGTPARQRVKGQLDPHREVALKFFSRVARPDVLLGNFFMGRDESMPGYEDAWALAGAPAEHERTINTFYHHKHDAETNFFYFLPQQTKVVGNPVSFPPADAPVGTRIPLNASCLIDRPTGSNIVDTTTNSSVKSGGERDAVRPRGEVPQVAARIQRCFFRRLPSRHHKRQLPLFSRYERRQLVVLKPFTHALLTAEEAAAAGRDGGGMQVRCSAADGYPILVLLS
ncbi:hypothetical protein, conserved [Trypanosoma cruzi]|uniref:Endonuclease/exonuclease/phosphatase domain-containing protein n=2 Tax=Trypanosoma cruzi TaxID=5693 RepID=Q4CTT6_TRYCC|nr:hypothetical protein, conserved [Trypanosoma cruzi]EAN83689.1 hypothetical protein, conserved [Trypanosoma cruzi]|eukprot:XP_805540.1 hypothetical protein [Trypanosoma cruzi strain CL Brener]